MIITDEFLIAPQGWQCPICNRVYSPVTPMCYYCGGERKIITYTTSTENIETAKMNSHAPIHPQQQIGEWYDKLKNNSIED